METIARRRRLSGNRVMVELVEQGIEARNQKERAFFDLAKRLREATDPKEAKALGEQLGRFLFGD